MADRKRTSRSFDAPPPIAARRSASHRRARRRGLARVARTGARRRRCGRAPDGDAHRRRRYALEISGSQRTRYERLDPQFRKRLDDSDQSSQLQTSVVFDWSYDAFQVVGEIMDSRGELNDERLVPH
jgi:hypothetical protein